VPRKPSILAPGKRSERALTTTEKRCKWRRRLFDLAAGTTSNGAGSIKPKES
jgi:hypothetical protein